MQEQEGKALADRMLAEQLRFRWDISPAEVSALATEAIRGHKEAIDHAVSLHASGETLTFEGFLKPLFDSQARYTALKNAATFMAEVGTDPAVREASDEAEERTSAYSIETGSRKDFCEALISFSETEEAKALTGEVAFYLDIKRRGFRQRGLLLDDASTAAQVKQISTRIAELEQSYRKHMRDGNTVCIFDADELEGLPESFLSARRQEDGTIKVEMIKPDFFAVMESCTVPGTRRKMNFAFRSRCLENKAILEELLSCRHKRAQLLGYATHQDYATEMNMATGAAVQQFLSDMAEKGKPLLDHDLSALRNLKAAREGGAEFDESDRYFYMALRKQVEFGVDQGAIKEFFPLDTVVSGMLGIFQEVLGLTFERNVTMQGVGTAPEGVEAIRATDAATGRLVGFIYFDLHPRDGKVDYPQCFGLQNGCMVNGEWQVPVAYVCCMLPKPTKEQPRPLLSHEDVKILFHEFGHSMHTVCSEAQLDYFSGQNVEADFLEAPSQTFELWCTQPATLRRISGHFETGQPIPDDLIEALVASNKSNRGIENARMTAQATYDQVRSPCLQDYDQNVCFTPPPRSVLYCTAGHAHGFVSRYGPPLFPDLARSAQY